MQNTKEKLYKLEKGNFSLIRVTNTKMLLPYTFPLNHAEKYKVKQTTLTLARFFTGNEGC